MSAELDTQMKEHMDAVSKLVDEMNLLFTGQDVRVVVTATEAAFKASLTQFIELAGETNAERAELLKGLITRLAIDVADAIPDVEEPTIQVPDNKIILKA